MSKLPYSPSDIHKKGAAVARHYGFLPVHDALTHYAQRIEKAERRPVPAVPQKLKKLDGFGGELTTLAKWGIEQSILPRSEPVLLFHSAGMAIPSPRSAGRQMLTFGLHIFGTKQSIAEALVLKTAMTILNECGVKDARIHVNSIGDRDSSAKHLREATVFLRKNVHLLPPQAIEALKDDAARALEFLYRRNHPILSEMPRPMEFLSSQSRRHLKEVLEFIETADLSYELDDLLLANRDVYSQAVYEIRAPNRDEDAEVPHLVIARGGRYDELPKRLFKVATPAVGLMFAIESGQPVPSPLEPAKRNVRKPQVCFIHVGFEAKLKSLQVIETFRRARIPFHQCLNSDRLTEQLQLAESVAAPYTVIMGHKEALEGTVIVRNTSTRAQQTVSVDLLPTYLRQSR
jgi:histidyl-tRNA synthetase